MASSFGVGDEFSNCMYLHRTVLNTQRIVARKLCNKEKFQILESYAFERGRRKADREVGFSVSLAEGLGDVNLAQPPTPPQDYLYPPASVPGE